MAPQAYRLVFIDEGYMTSDDFAVYYSEPRWWDNPPVRHGDGTTFGFADGHADNLLAPAQKRHKNRH